MLSIVVTFTDSDKKLDENETAEKLIRNLQVLEVISPHLHSTILPDVSSIFLFHQSHHLIHNMYFIILSFFFK